MKNNSDEMSTLAAIILAMCFMLGIGWIISLTKPECSMSGCDNDAKEGSRYCYMHQLSYDSYGNPDYHAVYNQSVQRRQKYSGGIEETSSTSSTKSSTTSSSSSSSSKSTKKSSSKKSNPYKSYDEGYESISEDDDYDWDRYWTDSDYADGVDEAMDEYDW